MPYFGEEKSIQHGRMSTYRQVATFVYIAATLKLSNQIRQENLTLRMRVDYRVALILQVLIRGAAMPLTDIGSGKDCAPARKRLSRKRESNSFVVIHF